MLYHRRCGPLLLLYFVSSISFSSCPVSERGHTQSLVDPKDLIGIEAGVRAGEDDDAGSGGSHLRGHLHDAGGSLVFRSEGSVAGEHFEEGTGHHFCCRGGVLGIVICVMSERRELCVVEDVVLQHRKA
jgi:hypothetical protein